MSLSIFAMSEIKLIGRVLNDDDYDRFDNGDAVIIKQSSGYAGYEAPHENNAAYHYEEPLGLHFSAGAVYRSWRSTYAMGLEMGSAGIPRESNILYNFSDCDGAIGPVKAKEILAQLEMFSHTESDEIIALGNWDTTSFCHILEDLKSAMRAAIKNGVVIFS